MGIRADEPDLSVFIVPLKLDTSSVDVKVNVQYLYSKTKIYTIGEAEQKLVLEK